MERNGKKLEENVACVKRKRNTWCIMVERTKWKKPPWIHRSRWQDNEKKALKRTRCEAVYLIYRIGSDVNTVMKLWLPQNAGNWQSAQFLASQEGLCNVISWMLNHSVRTQLRQLNILGYFRSYDQCAINSWQLGTATIQSYFSTVSDFVQESWWWLEKPPEWC